MVLSEQEKKLGELAAKVVAEAGGKVTFAQYDELMYPKQYITPLSWIEGWGNRVLWKRNNDKLCVFAACEMDLLTQTADGYELVD